MSDMPTDHLKYHLETLRARIGQVEGSDENAREWSLLAGEEMRLSQMLDEASQIPVYAKYEHDKLITLYLAETSDRVRGFVSEGDGSFANSYSLRNFIKMYARGQGFKVIEWVGDWPKLGEWPDQF